MVALREQQHLGLMLEFVLYYILLYIFTFYSNIALSKLNIDKVKSTDDRGSMCVIFHRVCTLRCRYHDLSGLSNSADTIVSEPCRKTATTDTATLWFLFSSDTCKLLLLINIRDCPSNNWML